MRAIAPEGMAPPLSNYSHAITVDVGEATLVLTAGQITFEDENVIGEGDMRRQTEYCYEQIQRVVEAAGGTMADVVKTNTYVTDISLRGEVAEARGRFVGDPPPTSTTVEVTALAIPGCLVEVEAIAVVRNR